MIVPLHTPTNNVQKLWLPPSPTDIWFCHSLYFSHFPGYVIESHYVSGHILKKKKSLAYRCKRCFVSRLQKLVLISLEFLASVLLSLLICGQERNPTSQTASGPPVWGCPARSFRGNFARFSQHKVLYQLPISSSNWDQIALYLVCMLPTWWLEPFSILVINNVSVSIFHYCY